MDRIRVMLVDDHALFREGLHRVLEHEADLECIASVENAEQAITFAKELCPNVVLIDIAMPGMDGLEAARCIKATCPATAVVILSAYKHRNYVLTAMRAGVEGYLLKDMHPNDLVRSIRMVHSGEGVFSLEATREVMHELASAKGKGEGLPRELHTRELEILNLVAGGLTNKDVARRLNLSSNTVRTHLDNIFAKLGVKSRTEAVIYALKEGLISTSEVRLAKD